MQSGKKFLNIPFTEIAKVIGLLISVVGILVIIAWQYDIAILKTFILNSVTMKANTAVCFLLAGLALFFLQYDNRRLSIVFSRLFAVIVVLTGLLTLFQYIFSVNFGIDELLFKETGNAIATVNPGRMAPNTALNFVLLGIVLFAFSFQKTERNFLTLLLFIVALSISLIGLLGYVAGLTELTGLAGYTKMAVNTSSAFIILSIGIFFTMYKKMKTRDTLEYKLLSGLTFASVLIIFVSIISMMGIKSLLSASDIVHHSEKVRVELTQILAEVYKLSSNGRGYLLSGDKNYSERSALAKDNILKGLNNLSSLIKDNTKQQESMISLNLLVKDRFEFSDLLVNTYKTKGPDAAYVIFRTSAGRIITDKITALIAQMTTEENRLISERNSYESHKAKDTLRIIFLNLSIQLILLAIVFVFMRRDVTGRRRAEESLKRLNEELEYRVQERTAELQESEKKYRDIIETPFVGVYSTSLLGEILFFNNALVQMMEADSIKELISSSTIVLYKNPDDRKHLLQRLQNNGIVNNFETELITKKGNTRTVILSAKLNVNIITGMMLDITERKKAEEALLRSEEKYRTIFENIQDVYYETSIEGTILEISPSIEILSKGQYHRDDLIGKSMYNFYSDTNERAALISQIKKRGTVSDFEITLKNKDGSLVPCSISSKICLDAQGRPKKIIGSIRDITDRKQAEEVLSNERTLLRTLLDLLPSFVFVKDHKMRFLVANVACARYMGASSPQELIGKTDAEFYPLEAATGFMSDELGVMEGIPVVNKEEGRVLSNGTRQIILTNKVPFRDNDGNIIGLVGASLDITELKCADEKLKNKIDELAIANKELAFQNEEKEKRAAELEIKVEERTKQLTEINKKLVEAKSEAEQANQAKSEFLANMSHEIRTPMNAVLGYTELLSSTIIDQTQKDYINSIKSSGRSLLTLINDILDLSKIEAGKLEMEYDYVDTYSFFSEFERIFSLKVTEKDLKFILDITSGTPQGVYIDEARVRQIVFNLIGNAIKFTSEGKITLKVYTENPQIVNYSKEKIEELIDLIIEVKDTGIGISKELQEAIFEPFVQERDYKHYGGTGLGLAITRRLAALMNGNINVQSELGKGSTFTVRIPEIPYLRDFSKTTVDIQIDPSEIVFEKAVILIADDVQHNRSYLRDALKNTNLEIVEAEDGLEAYKLAKEIVPDLIIADIRMPKMDGFQLLNKLKTDKKLKHIPVIAYSASVLKSQKERIHKSEFAGLLIKPVKIAELYIELMNFLPFKSTRKAESDKPHSEVNLFGEITDLPGLIQSLETSFYAIWKTFAVTQSIREIREFGKNLSQLGLEHNSNIITGYGKDLISAADSFNIEAILKLIGKYKIIIESLKDSTNNKSND
jgi:PAS domain S-box-containing protein